MDNESVEELFVKQLTASGSPFGVYGEGDQFKVFAADGSVVKAGISNRISALTEVRNQMASRPVLPERWRSEMAYEGVPTDDMRLIEPGAISFRDMPLPLMLQTETDVGHFGAILAGSIESAQVENAVAIGRGTLDDSDAGHQALSIIQARGSFGVSVDIGSAEGTYDETTGEERYTTAQVMGLTMTPFPAFAKAFIELDEPQAASETTSGTVPIAASGTRIQIWPSKSITEADVLTAWNKASAELESDCQECKETELVAAGVLNPPSSWFEDPEFYVGDDRLAEQPNGSFACPLTVTDDGRVFGHIASFRSCHTGYADRCVPPPRSPSDYAYFTTGTVTTSEGSAIRVGQLTMGAGHASTARGISLAQVKDHYDGGPGAIQMADVTVGEDQFGIWFAGALRSEVTEEQIRAFKACGVSGDWREVVRGKGLDLVACAAGIPVPGYPITRAIAASAAADLDVTLDLPMASSRIEDGEVVALVAAGAVRQPLPWEKTLAHQTAEIEELKVRVSRAERVTAPLTSLAGQKLMEKLTPSE